MTNIRQTDLLKYIVDKFNTNSFGIPFRMGTYGLNADKTFNEETYQVNKKAFVAVQGMATNGEYTPLPNVQLVAYDISLEFLVYIDNPISEIIRMAIEEIRDSFIGNMDILEIEEVDLEDETESAKTVTEYLKIATTANSLDFGEIFTISKKRYLNYSLTITLTVSKNVEMGNQFEWAIKLVDDVLYETVVPLVVSWGTTQDMESFQTLRSLNPLTVSKAKQVHNYVKSRGYGLSMTFLLDTTSPIIRRFFKDSFEEVETPNIYNVQMKFKEIIDGDYEYADDITFTKRVIFGEAQPSEISYGEPVVLSVGFVISAK